jgi:hypothetical protein
MLMPPMLTLTLTLLSKAQIVYFKIVSFLDFDYSDDSAICSVILSFFDSIRLNFTVKSKWSL